MVGLIEDGNVVVWFWIGPHEQYETLLANFDAVPLACGGERAAAFAWAGGGLCTAQNLRH